MRTNRLDASDVGVALVVTCVIAALIGIGIDIIARPARRAEVKPIATSLTFTQTNRLVVTHYIIIPATPADWSAMTSRYPANVTRTTLRFE
jgi:hypothetical protein